MSGKIRVWPLGSLHTTEHRLRRENQILRQPKMPSDAPIACDIDCNDMPQSQRAGFEP